MLEPKSRALGGDPCSSLVCPEESAAQCLEPCVARGKTYVKPDFTGVAVEAVTAPCWWVTSGAGPLQVGLLWVLLPTSGATGFVV